MTSWRRRLKLFCEIEKPGALASSVTEKRDAMNPNTKAVSDDPSQQPAMPEKEQRAVTNFIPQSGSNFKMMAADCQVHQNLLYEDGTEIPADGTTGHERTEGPSGGGG